MNQEVGSHKTNLLVVTCSSCYITLVGTANSPRFLFRRGEMIRIVGNFSARLSNPCEFL